MPNETVNTVIAVALASAGSITQATGYVVQKKGHNQVNEINSKKKSDEEKTTYLKNCMWLTGMCVYVCGSLLNASALKFGAQSVVAPLGALTLVANTFLATKFLGEPFGKNDIWGILLVIIGSVLAVIVGPKSEGPDPTVDELQHLAGEAAFLIFFFILTGIALSDFIGVKYYERKNFADKENNKITHGAKFLMVSYVALAAYFGSVNVLFMKSIVLMLASFTIDYFTGWLLYFVIIGIVIVNLLLEFFRQRALAYFGALFVVPIYQVLLIVGSAMMGAVFFNEFAGLKAYELVLFVIAIIITMIGVAIMAFNVGKVHHKVEKAIKVAFITVDEKIDDAFGEFDGPEFPVWGGYWSRIFQQYYLRKPAFMFNEALESIGEAMSTGISETVGVVTGNIDEESSNGLEP